MKKILSKIWAVLLFMAVLCGNTAYASTPSTSSDLKIGAWLGVQANTSEINTFQTLQGRKLDTIMVYAAWNTSFGEIKGSILDPIYQNGSIAIITWEQWGLSNQDITNGVKDNYIVQMANDMKSYGKEIWISLMHEGNGNWYDWALGDSTVNNNETYIAAYRHVVSLFRQQGATNVKWIWNINAANCGTGTSFLGHYPGDNYVDYIAIDGYNWGTTQSWGSTWQTFDEIFAEPYEAISVIDKPILITEFSCAEIGGNKAEWITDAFAAIRTKYPRVILASWFGENKETDWRINSSSSALAAYRAAVNGESVVTPSVSPSASSAPSIEPTVEPSVQPSPSSESSQNPADQKVSVDVTTSISSSINQNYTITANGTESIDLSKLVIRYCFTKEDAKDMVFWCDNASAQLNVAPWYVSLNADVKGTIAQTNDTCTLEIAFENSYALEPGTGSIQLQTRLAHADWSAFKGVTNGQVSIIYDGIVME